MQKRYPVTGTVLWSKCRVLTATAKANIILHCKFYTWSYLLVQLLSVCVFLSTFCLTFWIHRTISTNFGRGIEVFCTSPSRKVCERLCEERVPLKVWYRRTLLFGGSQRTQAEAQAASFSRPGWSAPYWTVLHSKRVSMQVSTAPFSFLPGADFSEDQ